MADMEEADAIEARRQADLTNALNKLSPEKRQQYENHISNSIEYNGDITHEFRAGIVKTLSQGLPIREEAQQVNKYIRAEKERIQRRLLNPESQRTEPAGEQGPGGAIATNAQVTKTADSAASRRDPTIRDYSELNRTHQEVARSLAGVRADLQRTQGAEAGSLAGKAHATDNPKGRAEVRADLARTQGVSPAISAEADRVNVVPRGRAEVRADLARTQGMQGTQSAISAEADRVSPIPKGRAGVRADLYKTMQALPSTPAKASPSKGFGR